MRALILLSLIAITHVTAAEGYVQLMVCQDSNGDYAEIGVDPDDRLISVSDLASSETWFRRMRDDLDSNWTVGTKGIEIRDSADSQKLMSVKDISEARQIKILLAEPHDIYSAGAYKAGIHKADEVVMTKHHSGHWDLSFGRSRQGNTGGYYQTIGKTCELKSAGFQKGWPEKHHKSNLTSSTDSE